MREIKFRVWNTDTKSWIIMKPFNDELFITTHWDRATAGQFTGLHDKNGKEIWEGDIIKCFEGNYKVSYSEIDARFFGHFLDKKGSSYFRCGEELKEGEILGNIYENPELLTP